MIARPAPASGHSVTDQADRPANFPNRFQRESLRLITSLIEVTASAFYLVDPDMRHRGVALFNIDPEVEKEYQNKFRHLDPLNPAKFDTTGDTVVTIDSQLSPALLRQSIYYQEFMRRHDHRYVADMFFRRQGAIVAVLSMLRHESLGPYTREELSLLRKLQPFLEYTLNAVYMPKRIEERQSMRGTYGLTERELDVLELVVAGASNKAIAAELGVGLATVKTHLLHLFRKTGVSSRVELLTRAIADLGPAGRG